ncbi:MAG TPA: CHAT domain-containing protein [Pyrinomonadaceae bacterium]|nr:CHAT domain-containing protein [Pyrinomonadaceae bacterium]
MFNERAFISQVERANPEELADILIRPTLEQEKALRAHLGDERYLRMHSMALKRKVSRSGVEKPKGNVVVIHGIMGAELSVSKNGGNGDLTWVNAFRILRGWLDRLRLADDGRSEANSKFTVSASGIMKRYYGEMLLALAENWNVKDFSFDWRKDLELAADSLNVKIGTWFNQDEPVHIVAHSMGGLVARTFIKKYADRWHTMWDQPGNGKDGGRLIMLGTPNYGSFAIPQVITGVEGLVRKLALLDLRHDIRDLLETFNSFVGSYQMMPSPAEMTSIKDLYEAGTYSKFNVTVPQQHLTRAKRHHEWLKDAVDPARMIYVAGYDQPTYSDISDWNKLDNTKGYAMTSDGDGRVTHRLGLLKAPDGTKVDTYYIKEDHGNLSTNAKILATLDQLLKTGKTDALLTKLPTDRALKGESQEQLRARYEASLVADEAELALSLGRMSARSIPLSRGTEAESPEQHDDELSAPTIVSPEERKVEEAITRGFLPYRSQSATRDESFEAEGSLQAKIEIGLVYGGIQSIDYDNVLSDENHPVDCVSVGHYIGVQPQRAELALDKAISASLLENGTEELTKADLILTQYTERGIIYGQLGQPFLMPDPRTPPGSKARLIAIAGMNEPGRFGMPELTVLARELCWALGRLKKVHLATVLIGSGEGNLGLGDAVSAWLSGIRRAVAGSPFDDDRRLKRVTFVEYDARKVIQLNKILLAQVAEQKQRFEIVYKGLSETEISDLKESAFERAKDDLLANWREDLEGNSPRPNAVPSRVTLSLDSEKSTYRFGAITENASIPERDTVIDPNLVWTANDELAGEQIPAVQLERGRFLEGLLMPADLRKQLYGGAPLVMMLDSTTARIHWEMVAQPSLDSSPLSRPPSASGRFEYEDGFLGTSRGFTRQLRTTFAPPPEPPPPPQSVLRVLIVADPAADAHLPGAEEEAVAIADLFESYNGRQQNSTATRVEVKRLFGPIDATRTNVLRELMLRRYDILHFAGHCVFQWGGDPNLSGWIFNAKRKELLSANELNRIDRIPKFVFSNACESGVTPDRAQDRDDRLAPSFAEAFFNRGVANFVCTAWPVDDVAARVFATTLYSHLLGIQNNSVQAAVVGPEPMHEAMRKARLAIAETPNGRTTWGAYQHYGNPYFRLFYETQKTSTAKKTSTQDGKGKASNRKPTPKVKNARRSKKRQS